MSPTTIFSQILLTKEKNAAFINELIDVVSREYRFESFDVGQLARSINVSKVHLNRKTKEITGYTASKLIVYYRVEVAKAMLVKKDTSISEVAVKCGFRHQANFCRSFSSLESCSPMEYKKQHVSDEIYDDFEWGIPMSDMMYMHVLNLCRENEWLSSIFRTVIKDIGNNVLSVQQLADITCLSVCTFNRRVKKIFKVTPQKLIRDLRLQYAIELIAVGENTITEIAYSVGFYDPAHFSKCFKSAFGCLPSNYNYTLSETSMKWLYENLMFQNDK